MISYETKIHEFDKTTMKQNIHLEMESGINCMNYPSGDFSSYRDCDENFVYNLSHQESHVEFTGMIIKLYR